RYSLLHQISGHIETVEAIAWRSVSCSCWEDVAEMLHGISVESRLRLGLDHQHQLQRRVGRQGDDQGEATTCRQRHREVERGGLAGLEGCASPARRVGRAGAVAEGERAERDRQRRVADISDGAADRYLLAAALDVA